MIPRKTLLLSLVLVAAPAAAAVAVGAVPFRGSSAEMTRYASNGESGVAGASGRRGSIRVRYVLPAKWRRRVPLNTRTLRFDTRNSCRHQVAFTPRLVAAPDGPATERAAQLTPAASPAHVQGQGTREGAAFRVVRAQGSADLRGVLVQPLPQRSAAGVPGRVWAELHATATYDRRTECHSGGPRTVAAAIADGFGAGGAGGFVFRP